MTRRAFKGDSMVVSAAALFCVAMFWQAGAQAQEMAPPAEADQTRAIPATEPGAETAPLSGGAGASEPISERDPYLLYCKSLFYSARRGAQWLRSTQRSDGPFVYGWIPSLNRPLPGDNHLRQAGAAAALARAASVTGEVELDLAARQAIFVLLASGTAADAGQANVRQPTLAPAVANPVGFSALLLLAISELPAPGETLVEQGEQLARFLASRQRPDGSLNISNSLVEDLGDPPGGVNYYPGEALYALMRSYGNRPEPWKVEVVCKSLAFYHRHWQEQPQPAFVPWQTGAFAEAYLLTRQPELAELVFAMNDWIVGLQYQDAQAAQDGWIGGFASFEGGHVLRTTPGAATGSYAEGLVDAYRVAKLAGDERRMTVYRQAAESAFKFLMASQYSLSTFPHFEHWFGKKLAGAFYASAADGTVRIDYTQHAINGMFHYLSHVAEYDRAAAVSNPLQAN